MPDLDIPEVQEQIELIAPVIHRDWIARARRAEANILDELDSVDRKGLTTPQKAAIVAAILLLLRKRHFSKPSQRRTPRQVDEATKTLMRDARRTIADLIDRSDELPAFPINLSLNLADSLLAESRWRGLSESRTGHLESLIFEWFEVHTPQRAALAKTLDDLRDAADAAAKAAAKTAEDLAAAREGSNRDEIDRATEAARSAKKEAEAAKREAEIAFESIPKRSDGSPGSIDAEDWKRALNEAFHESFAQSEGIVDTWAYNVRATAALHTAEKFGLRELVAVNNPPTGPDERTTAFCRWVHKKVIRLDGSWRKNLKAYFDAVQDDDPESAQKARPVRAFKKTEGPNAFRQHFAHVGLPGYHPRCRTQALPRDIAETYQ